MGCAPIRIWRPSETKECDMYPYIFDTANETHQGLPDGMQGYLAACYRNIIDTEPSYYSKPDPESNWKSNRKPERAEWTDPKI